MNRSGMLREIAGIKSTKKVGYVTRVTSTFVEADGPPGKIGDICEIEVNRFPDTTEDIVLAEIVGIETGKVTLIPLGASTPVAPDDRVTARTIGAKAPVGGQFSGRLINAMGEPLDEAGAVESDEDRFTHGEVMSPLDRESLKDLLVTGIRAVDGLFPIGRGQRIGVFSAAGVGKTSLILQIASQANVDRVVMCLVGERGREVEQIWRTLQSISGAEGQYTCVAATSDVSASLRIRAVSQALCLAEYWRDKGEHVLFVLDSSTRLAMALREVGLSAGEPPTMRAYTPNVFAALPRIVERCGASRSSGGAITAVMTVLSESDHVDDPIAETMKSLLDGHIILSRDLAERGHFPAIDPVRSVCRGAEQLIPQKCASAVESALSRLSVYEDAKLMVENGIYKDGANREIDDAIRSRPDLMAFLRQPSSEFSDIAHTRSALLKLHGSEANRHAY